MNRSMRAAFACLAVWSLVAAFRVARAGETADTGEAMRKNFGALMALQPFIADPKAFSDAQNRSEIQKNLDSMTGLRHVFPKKMSEQEPGLAAVSTLFSDYLSEIQKSFKAGGSDSYLRNRLRTMTGLCLSCHTRVATDKNFVDPERKVESAPLTGFQRAEFYAATRQFDKAIEAFDKIISSAPSGELGYVEFIRAVRESLSITIRVKQDPKATSRILEKLARRKDAPDFFRRYVVGWKKDADQWAKEKKHPKQMPAPDLIEKAKTLIEHGANEQLFTVDPIGDVSYLRATSYIHEALQKEPGGKFRGEALYLLGNCYDALQDPLLWALDSLYFEACIREFPHSPIAKKCYGRYAAKLYFGYSGSGGTFVPEEETGKLSELRKLSE